ncbi:MAG: PEP-CTERM sorting domain-containing protein [Alteromonadaceae bacterium]|nr:PEP-CTERM sorting domain-containing protein [Alteromonadaceae bacterium]
MNKIIKNVVLLAILLISAPQVLAGAITNGDFANSCNLNGWNQDGDASNFNIGGSSPNCTADISVTDFYWSNTLWQSLDFSASSNDSSFLLFIDFSVTTDDFSGLIMDDYFSIGLVNENTFEFILISEESIFGDDSYVFDFDLDSSYINKNWALEFQINDEYGSFDDTFTSTLSINNVSLTEVLAPVTGVPEPTSLAIFTLGFAGLFSRRKLANELIRKSFVK